MLIRISGNDLAPEIIKDTFKDQDQNIAFFSVKIEKDTAYKQDDIAISWQKIIGNNNDR